MSISKRSLGGALTITLLSGVLAACGGSTPTTAATAQPATGVTPPPASVAPSEEASPSAAASAGAGGGGLPTSGRIEVKDKGFAITLPNGWTRVDVSAGDLAAAMAAANMDPALAQQYAAQIRALAASGIALFALGPDPSAGTQLNVLAVPGAGMSLDLLEQINTAALQTMSEGDVQSERVTLSAGDAIHFHYAIAVEGTTSPTVDQYFLLAGANQLIVTVTNSSAADAQAIANSIETLD
jgi:hypothetical protein